MVLDLCTDFQGIPVLSISRSTSGAYMGTLCPTSVGSGISWIQSIPNYKLIPGKVSLFLGNSSDGCHVQPTLFVMCMFLK